VTALLLGLVCLLHGQTPAAAPRVVITIDVESNDAFTLPAQVDARCTDGSACGLMEIARMLKSRGLAATFFLNVYEYPRWGEPAMRDIAQALQAQGQDVALHTHPETAFDPARSEMYQYTLDEQTQIVGKGVQLLSAWTGKKVVAHRAGDYSADRNTLEALRRNGVSVDSSLFWQNPSCRLNDLGLPRNLPSFPDGITEIPVTVYERSQRPHGLPAALPAVDTVRKVDANWFIDEAEAKAAMEGLVAADPPYIVLFLHSFSFMARGEGKAPVADRRARDIFGTLLDQVAQRHLEVATMRDLAAAGAVTAAPGKDIVPQVRIEVGLLRYLAHWVRADRFGVIAIGVAVASIAALLAFLALRRRRRAA
jgi:peptidoglycan/xylan/chitin deacetylase (PgdA/CDA1 family)